MKYRIAACVVFYHPNADVVSNINSYHASSNLLIIIDNSETLNTELQEKLYKAFPGIIYIYLHKNVGIASALNLGCKIAIENNCNWMLTMDQDSSFIGEEFSRMVEGLSNSSYNFQKVGIISPFHVLYTNSVTIADKRYSIKNIVMTSGNLLNLDAYTIIGPFDEKLFMDYVDYEYCLRFRKNKYKIVQDNWVNLKHSLGNFEIKKIFRLKIGVSNHNSSRRYYMTRNSLYVGFKYFASDKIFFLHMLKNILIWDPLIILSFEKNKLAKLRAMHKGAFHFIIGRYGKVI